MTRTTVDALGTSEADLPPVLVTAMQDDEAIRMVQEAGIKINVTGLNNLLIGGRIKHAPENWKIVAPKNSFVLKVVSEGYKIDFIGAKEPPVPMNFKNPPTDPEGQAVLDQEVKSMQEKGVIRIISENKDGVVSPFFATPKAKPGKWRPILSMKKVNKFVRYVKFKMTTVRDIQRWLKQDNLMTSLDLSDAYFSMSALVELVDSITSLMSESVQSKGMSATFGFRTAPFLARPMVVSIRRRWRLAFSWGTQWGCPAFPAAALCWPSLVRAASAVLSKPRAAAPARGRVLFSSPLRSGAGFA